MARPGDDGVAAVQPKGEGARWSFALAHQFDRQKGRIIDVDVELFNRSDEDEAAVGLTPQDAGEEAHHRGAPYRRAFVKPGAVPRDPHPAVSAMRGIPALDWRRLPLFGVIGDGR